MFVCVCVFACVCVCVARVCVACVCYFYACVAFMCVVCVCLCACVCACVYLFVCACIHVTPHAQVMNLFLHTQHTHISYHTMNSLFDGLLVVSVARFGSSCQCDASGVQSDGNANTTCP